MALPSRSMDATEIEMRVELHILINISYIHNNDKPTFGTDQQQFIDSLMAFMPHHVDEQVVKQCLSAKTHLCNNLVALYDKISPMFVDLKDADEPIVANFLADDASKVRCEYALMMLSLSREFLNRPDSAILFKISFKEELVLQQAVVETYFKFKLEKSSFVTVIERLRDDISQIKVPGRSTLQPRDPQLN